MLIPTLQIPYSRKLKYFLFVGRACLDKKNLLIHMIQGLTKTHCRKKNDQTMTKNGKIISSMNIYVKEFNLGEWFLGESASGIKVLLLPAVASGLTLPDGEMAGELDGLIGSVVVSSSSKPVDGDCHCHFRNKHTKNLIEHEN